MSFPTDRLTRNRTLAAEVYAIVHKAIDRRPVPRANITLNNLRYGDNVPGTASPSFNIIDLQDGATAYDNGKYLKSTATGWEWAVPTAAAAIRVDSSLATIYSGIVGAINGANRLYTVSEGNYTTATLKVWQNKVLLDDDEFTEVSPAAGTFQVTVAPRTDDVLVCEYMYT